MRKARVYRLFHWFASVFRYIRDHRWTRFSVGVLVLTLWSSAFYFWGYTSLQHQVQNIYDALPNTSKDVSSPDSVNMIARLKAIVMQASLSEQVVTDLRNTLADKEEDITELREQIYFYRAIIAPEDIEDGLSVLSAKLEKPYQSGEFPFELILRKAGSSGKVIKGQIDIVLSDGDTDDAHKLRIDDFYTGDSRFAFKYFQRLKGVIVLPDNFFPVKMDVKILPSNEEQIKKTWYWGDLLGGKHAYRE